MINFWLFDHASWLSGGARVLSASPARLSVVQSRFWLAAVICSIILDTRALDSAISKLDRDTESASAPLPPEVKAVVVREVRNMCDLVVAANNSALVHMPPLLVGVCGAVSAASVIYEALTTRPK